MLLDDFLANYALWLWVPHRASLVRDDGGGLELSSLRAQRSNPWLVRKEGGLLRCARNEGSGDGRETTEIVIPGCALAQARNPSPRTGVMDSGLDAAHRMTA
jgi:hypothetical protein